MGLLRALHYATWHRFKAEFTLDLFEDGVFRKDRFLFRGHADESWTLASSFDRWSQSFGVDGEQRVTLEQELFQAFRAEVLQRDLAPDDVIHDDMKLRALGQHFGLPTRLLDWTTSPYQAAFFAFQDQVAGVPQVSPAAIWAIDRLAAGELWSRSPGVRIVEVAPKANPRMRNQSGKFTFNDSPQSSVESFLESVARDVRGAGAVLYKVVLPYEESRTALLDLDAMGINHASTYPGLEGSARAAKLQVRLRAP